jgi:hypothetical protein
LGKTLVDWAVEFAFENGFAPEVIVRQKYPGTAGALDGRTGLVLFGDNFYSGFCPPQTFANYTVTYRDCEGLAVCAGMKLVEKPHRFTGKHFCFTGHCYIDSWVDLDRSVRGEFEITDLLNKIGARPLSLLCAWEHLSVPSDHERVRQYVEDCKG